MKQLEKLLRKKLLLHIKKYHIYEKFKHKTNYYDAKPYIIKLNILINQELANHRRLISILKEDKLQKKYQELLIKDLQNMVIILKEELDALSDLNQFNLFCYNLKTLFKSHEPYIIIKRKLLDAKLKKELKELEKISKQLDKYYSSIKGFKQDKKNLKNALKLVKDIQREMRVLASSVGDQPQVRKSGKNILKLIKQLEKTELYGFIRKDVEFIKEKANEMIKQPKEHRLAYIFGTFYIISPGTFELTGIILTAKYVGQYSISKGKKIHQFVKKKLPRAKYKRRL